ncbi:site-specific integrase [Psychrobacillus psychrodurans]|uniref:tyrosine-type recombinase/integrase n=1 Tax=Psychrobacillus psychrodurans TaxID=126157 RepID=UPI001F4EE850|nr:site-specific integrase [Psychrobacillus psychrodurans]MCK1997950.1 site-specific integrase [Psychrobacillus psychrodurans]
MTSKKPIYTVSEDLSDIFKESQLDKKTKAPVEGFPIVSALKTVVRQMEISGNRPRTISDYERYVNHFSEITGVQVLEQLTVQNIYIWLDSMKVSNQTKLTRLKCLKAFLSRCFYNGWLTRNFWRQVNIKVDTPVKEGAKEQDVMLLLSLLDLSDFVELRDATAVLIMFQTGLRSSTVAQLEDKHVFIGEKLLKVDGGLLKNHDQIHLPFDDMLSRLLVALMNQNNLIRRENRVDNSLLFITQKGETVLKTQTNNIIQKRLNKYSKEYGMKNLNPHALRRGFAKRLLNRGANVAEISKALSHNDLAVTTRYLHLDKDEVAESLRKYL